MTTKSQILRAIRKHCVECMVGRRCDVAKCAAAGCHLHRFRMGQDPSPGIAAKERAREMAEAKSRGAE